MESLLGVLVAFGSVITIEPGVEALAFYAVVILTIFAVETFGPRLMWDAAAKREPTARLFSSKIVSRSYHGMRRLSCFYRKNTGVNFPFEGAHPLRETQYEMNVAKLSSHSLSSRPRARWPTLAPVKKPHREDHLALDRTCLPELHSQEPDLPRKLASFGSRRGEECQAAACSYSAKRSIFRRL